MPGTPFNEQFDQHGQWRREFALRLKLLGEWLQHHDLADAAVEEQLRRLEQQVRSDKVAVAFVAEFSRGKSELINAIFFANYGRRIMPASAGRTTMCPTELGWEPGVPTSLRLLPIETRRESRSLADWRGNTDAWTRLPLEVQDPAQLAEVLGKVAEVRRVAVDEARALGFWHDETPDDNPPQDAAGLVEVPRWRHALINIPHPLLKQGLVILDTPGLNAIGAEPELTVNLIPQAEAVVFILGADTGVTKSDLAIWREHLAPAGGGAGPGGANRLVVLNKIDTLWDALSTPQQVQAQIERQRAASAELLGVPVGQVIAVSAQKGLVAKIGKDDALLQASALPLLEDVLAQGIMGQRQHILRSAVAAGVAELRAATARNLLARRREYAEQMLELRGLRGKNVAVIGNMRARIEAEQRDFDQSTAKIQAVRAVHLKLLRDAFHTLGSGSLKRSMAELARTLQQPGIKLGVRRAYADAFDGLKARLQQAQTAGEEIHAMLAGTFRQLNAEYGFSLQPPPVPSLLRYRQDLERVEASHAQYLSINNVLKLAQPSFTERLMRALLTRLRTIYESAVTDLELWSKSATAQLDAQIGERRRSFKRRSDAMERIHSAAGSLAERIDEVEAAEQLLTTLDARLTELTGHFTAAPAVAAPASEPQRQAA